MATVRDHRGKGRGRGVTLKPGGHRGGGTKFQAHAAPAPASNDDDQDDDGDDDGSEDEVSGTLSYGSPLGDARGNRVGHSVPDYIGADDSGNGIDEAVKVVEDAVSPLASAARQGVDDAQRKVQAGIIAASPPLGIPWWVWGVGLVWYASKRRR